MKLKNFLNSASCFTVAKNFGMIKETCEMYADEVYELINSEDVIYIKEDEEKLTVYVYDYNNYYTIKRMIF